jgi:hypothetical protein
LDEEGEIKTLRIIDSGVGYQSNKVSISVATNTGSGFSATPVVGGVTNYTGYYANNDGKLSSNKRMFDGSYYQDFSYVLRSEIAFSRYRETYKKLIHPAGFKMFGEVLIKRNLVDSLPFHSEFQRYEIPYIGHYTPYRMGTTADLYYLYTSGFNPRGNTFNSYQRSVSSKALGSFSQTHFDACSESSLIRSFISNSCLLLSMYVLYNQNNNRSTCRVI